MDTLSLVKDISITIGGLITLITFWVGLIQYIRQNRQNRATQFVEARRRFLENPSFREILNLLATDSPQLKDIPIQERRNLVGFLEEVALMVNSRIIRQRVAHYMFGYYVLLVDGSENFWDGLDKKSDYWAVFRSFAYAMRSQSEHITENAKDLAF